MLDKPLWKHQEQAIALADRLTDLALLFEMGTGKTRTTIEIIRRKFNAEKRVMRTLILGPVITVKNWQNEFAMFSKIPPGVIVPLVGSGKKRAATFEREATSPGGTLTKGCIFITNYEAMQMKELHDLMKLWQPEILVCDEIHYLKDYKSVRSHKVIELLGEEPIINTRRYTRKVKHVYGLTGTMILNTPMDAFNQYRVLDSGATFGTNFFEFRARFFEDLNAGMPSQRHFAKYIPRPESIEVLNELIYRKAVRALKKDCLDLPPLVRSRIDVEMGAEQAKLYREMKQEYITWVKAHQNSDEPLAVVAQMAITKALRLQQIVSGFCKTEDGTIVPVKDNPRLCALEELLEQLTPSHKVIVWATFKENYRAIAEVCTRLGIKFVEIHGDVSTAKKNENIEAFRSDPRVRVCIANQAAAGIGVNLVEYADKVLHGASSYSIYYSKNFSLAQDLQSESRNYRGGSEVYDKVTRIDLVASETIDELILEALREKQEIAEQVLAWTDKL